MEHVIIYYSYSNNTKKLVERIASLIETDVIEITPRTPYSENYQDVVDLGNDDKTKMIHPELSKTTFALEKYKKVLLCSPTWWDDIAPCMYSFLDNNDLNGKQVALLTTHGGFACKNGKQSVSQYCPLTMKIDVSFDETIMETPFEEVEDFVRKFFL